MPTYEYRCGKCGHQFEAFQSMKAGALRKCPVCGKSALKRLIGVGAGVIFKGGGFYETDYRSDAYKKAAKADADAATAPSEKKSDATKTGDGAKKEATAKEGAKSEAPKAESSGVDAGKAAAAGGADTKSSNTGGKDSGGSSSSKSGEGKSASSSGKNRKPKR